MARDGPKDHPSFFGINAVIDFCGWFQRYSNDLASMAAVVWCLSHKIELILI